MKKLILLHLFSMVVFAANMAFDTNTKLTSPADAKLRGQSLTISGTGGGSITLTNGAGESYTMTNTSPVDIREFFPDSIFTGLRKYTVTAATNWTSAAAVAGTDYSGPVTVREEDGSPTAVTTTLRFPNGSLTDNGSGSISVAFSGAGTPGGANKGIQYNDSSAFGSVTNYIFESVTNVVGLYGSPGANTVPSFGYELRNENAASSGNQQYSGRILQRGNGWKTTATAASQPVDFQYYVIPIQGSTAPTGSFVIESRINEGAWGNQFVFSTSGTLVTPNSITSGADILSPSTSGFRISSRSRISSSADGVMEVNNNGVSARSTLQFNPAGLTKTTSYTLVALDSGLECDTVGAVGAVTFTLPTAVRNMRYSFYVGAAQTLTILAVGSDTIRHAATVSAAAGSMSSNAEGNVVELRCVAANKWVVQSIIGTWTGPT